jgi:hypothetical protein
MIIKGRNNETDSYNIRNEEKYRSEWLLIKNHQSLFLNQLTFCAHHYVFLISEQGLTISDF